MGMKRALTTAYHPQADGQMEIMNQTLEIFLRAYVGPNQDNWVSSLNGLSLSYSSTPHTATGFTPAYLLRRYVPTCGCGPLLCMAGILVPFSNEIITGVRGLVGPLLYMVELYKHHLI